MTTATPTSRLPSVLTIWYAWRWEVCCGITGSTTQTLSKAKVSVYKREKAKQSCISRLLHGLAKLAAQSLPRTYLKKADALTFIDAFHQRSSYDTNSVQCSAWQLRCVACKTGWDCRLCAWAVQKCKPCVIGATSHWPAPVKRPREMCWSWKIGEVVKHVHRMVYTTSAGVYLSKYEIGPRAGCLLRREFASMVRVSLHLPDLSIALPIRVRFPVSRCVIP